MDKVRQSCHIRELLEQKHTSPGVGHAQLSHKVYRPITILPRLACPRDLAIKSGVSIISLDEWILLSEGNVRLCKALYHTLQGKEFQRNTLRYIHCRAVRIKAGRIHPSDRLTSQSEHPPFFSLGARDPHEYTWFPVCTFGSLCLRLCSSALSAPWCFASDRCSLTQANTLNCPQKRYRGDRATTEMIQPVTRCFIPPPPRPSTHHTILTCFLTYD